MAWQVFHSKTKRCWPPVISMKLQPGIPAAAVGGARLHGVLITKVYCAIVIFSTDKSSRGTFGCPVRAV